MIIKEHKLESVKEALGGIILILFISLIISIGVKWILALILIPLLLFLTFLGLEVSIEPEVLQFRISILAFVLVFIYLLFGERLIKKSE